MSKNLKKKAKRDKMIKTQKGNFMSHLSFLNALKVFKQNELSLNQLKNTLNQRKGDLSPDLKKVLIILEQGYHPLFDSNFFKDTSPSVADELALLGMDFSVQFVNSQNRSENTNPLMAIFVDERPSQYQFPLQKRIDWAQKLIDLGLDPNLKFSRKNEKGVATQGRTVSQWLKRLNASEHSELIDFLQVEEEKALLEKELTSTSVSKRKHRI